MLFAIDAANTNEVWVAGGAGFSGNLPGSTIPVLFHVAATHAAGITRIVTAGDSRHSF